MSIKSTQNRAKRKETDYTSLTDLEVLTKVWFLAFLVLRFEILKNQMIWVLIEKLCSSRVGRNFLSPTQSCLEFFALAVEK